MRPYIHNVYSIKDGTPDKKITTIKGKKKFQEWAIRRCFEESGPPVCFCLEMDSRYYEAIPFVYMKGKNKGKDRLVFVRITPENDSMVNDIMF